MDIFSCNLSRIKRHSSVVPYSLHDGVDVLVAMSYADLQSVTALASGALRKTLLGLLQSTDGSLIHSQHTRIYPSRSSAELSEMASALSVDVTTRGIRFELQAIGQTTVLWFCASF